MLKRLLLAIALAPTLVTAQVASYEKIVLTPKNAVTIRGPIDSGSVQKAMFELAVAVSRRSKLQEPIYLVLDSPGGSIEDGLAFIEFAKTIPNLHTISIFSASMASAIVEQLPGKRFITNNGYLMFHRARGGFQGQFEDGEVESRLGMAKQLVRRIEQVNANRMLMALPDYKRLVINELWLDSEQALLYRAADKVADIYCSQSLIDSRDQIHISVFMFSITLVFSNCPLFRSPLEDKKNVYQIPTMSSFRPWSPSYYQDRLSSQQEKK